MTDFLLVLGNMHFDQSQDMELDFVWEVMVEVVGQHHREWLKDIGRRKWHDVENKLGKGNAEEYERPFVRKDSRSVERGTRTIGC